VSEKSSADDHVDRRFRLEKPWSADWMIDRRCVGRQKLTSSKSPALRRKSIQPKSVTATKPRTPLRIWLPILT